MIILVTGRSNSGVFALRDMTTRRFCLLAKRRQVIATGVLLRRQLQELKTAKSSISLALDVHQPARSFLKRDAGIAAPAE